MPNDRFLRVRNFEKYQMFNSKNLKHQPNPHWIKLYHALLADRFFYRLPDSTKFHVVGLFLIASQHNNRIPCDLEWIRHQIGATEKVDLQALLESRFVEWIEPAGPSTPPVTEIIKNAEIGASLLDERECEILDSREATEERREEKKEHIAKQVSRNTYSGEFEEFWEKSSKRGSKWEAYRVWQKISADERKTATAAMIHAIRTEWANQETQFIPHVVRWLRGRRWEVSVTSPAQKVARLPL